ncbi:Protein CBG19539 [Caenorhabditis briggsae]|uniref:Protein CBG19539 n=1 Tax=Caenorhabditis briggsae TaxID=6238 RepID=A8XVU9_CAEBR|nr:Protein CBG19539 [Caenorhabditis briggsae]CAP36768.1 Protein CBG19539 [Caenorhabditis briggsae]
MDNINGGVSCDLDQYGFEVPNSSTTILNGDVSFRTENAADRRNDTEETELHYRFSLKRHKNYLAKINYDESRGKTRFNKAGLQMMMDACRSKLLPFNYRRNNLSPPYTCYIQLTITQEDATTIQRYEYNHKLYEAAKKLNETLFANRHVIIVNHLQSACFDVLQGTVGHVDRDSNRGQGRRSRQCTFATPIQTKSYKIQNQNNMVSHTVPMGYESLRTVLLHTDPNLRFKIAQRIPKIRLTEKAVPLRIRCLELEESTTKVNSQSYKLGVYRHYHTEDIPMGIKNRNKWGGVSCDLDQYGFEIPNSFDPILNGDVSFRREIATDRRRDTEEREQRLQFSLRRYEEALAKINQLESEGKTVDDFLAGPMNEDDQRIRRTLEIPKEQLQSGVNRYRSALLPFHYRRNNLSPPYTCYIQLTIIQGNVTNIQRYEYNHKLYEASKKLNEILFVNRSVIIADHFQNTCADVLRTPIGFKIFANNVYGYNFQIIPMSSIVDSSRALPELSISVTSGVVSNFSHSLVKNAETLSIYINEGRINQLAIALETMENQHIHIQFGQFDNPSPNEYFQLLHGWLATERSVGLMITSGLKTDQIGEEILDSLPRRITPAKRIQKLRLMFNTFFRMVGTPAYLE